MPQKKNTQSARTYPGQNAQTSALGTPTDSFLGGNGQWLFAAGLAVALLLAYRDVGQAGFIWDDNGHVTRPGLRSLHGLWETWFKPGATQQYYPVLHTLFWVEHRIWADAPLGYHLLNLFLHWVVVLLLFRVLLRLHVPGALLGASVFALHPVCVESVAWISEQKNTLSAVFYLASALAYLRFDADRRPARYALATTLFLFALLSKSVTATLPAALLVVFWWKRGRLSWARDVLPLIPWLGMAAASGLMTSWMERTFVGAHGAAYALSPADRILVAGRAPWFYIGKLAWPARLIFIYPHWDVDSRAPWQYLYPAAAAGVLGWLYSIRRRSRAPLASALLFVGTLFPALGFVDVYPFVYSYVADHFQYLAAAMAISAAAAGLTTAARRLAHGARSALATAAAGLVVFLGFLTSRQCAMYTDMETLWLTTIARNPGCWMAYGNLGDTYLQQGRVADAVEQYGKAVAVDPRNVESHNNLGIAYLHEGLTEQAVAQFDAVLGIDPKNAEAHNNLGNIYSKQRRLPEAIAQYRLALATDPSDVGAHFNLGDVLMRSGNVAEAVPEFQRALAIDPEDTEAHYDLATALLRLGRLDESAEEFRRTLQLDPSSARSHVNLGAVFLKKGLSNDAIAQYQEALRIAPDDTDAHFNLGNIFIQTGRLDEAIAEFRRIVEINPADSEAHRNLGVALFKRGRVDEADGQFQEAARLQQ